MKEPVTDHSPPLSPPSPFPRSLPACLPFLWSRVLFPGQSPAQSSFRWPALLLLLVLPGVLLYPCLSFRLFEPDEGRYAEIPREMLLRGEWVVPYLQGEPYLDKPPLFYWLVMASYRLLGVHDWSARLIPALAVHGCVLLVYLLGRRTLGERAAFWGALALGLAPGFVSMGRLLVLDGLLTFWVTLSWLAAFEALRGQRLRWGWWLTAAVACGLGVLTKGPVALVLLLPPLWANRRLAGSTCPIGWPARLLFAAVLLAVCVPWYVAICLRMPAFAGYFLWQHNVVRFLTPFDHLQPVWYYGPIVLAGLLPVSLLVIPFLRFLLSGDPSTARRRPPELGGALLAGGWCLLFFSLSGCKLPTYVLPAFPPLALAVGYYLAQGRPRPWVRGLAFGTTAFLLAVAHYLVIPAYALYHSPVGNPADVERLCGGGDLPIVCYPRNCDSVAFYLARDDLRNYRSKALLDMVRFTAGRPRTVVVFTHRHSLEVLRENLPAPLRMVGETQLGGGASGTMGRLFLALRRLTGETRQEMYYIAVVEFRNGRGP